MGFSMDGNDANILETLSQARRMGMLSLGFTGKDGGETSRSGLDFCFVVPTDDAMAAQETHVTLYHVLWESVHIFFEHEGLLE